MKYKIIYQNGPFYFEAEALNESERKEAIKGLIYATKDLNEAKILNDVKTSNYEPRNDVSGEINSAEITPVVEYASEGQIRYMNKLNIAIPENCTKIQAIDLINQWKIEHNIPINNSK